MNPTLNNLLRMGHIDSKGLSEDVERRALQSPVLKILDLVEAIVDKALVIHLRCGSVFYNVVRLLLVVCEAAELSHCQLLRKRKPFCRCVFLRYERILWIPTCVEIFGLPKEHMPVFLHARISALLCGNSRMDLSC